MLVEGVLPWVSQVGAGLTGGSPRLGCVASSLAPGRCVRGPSAQGPKRRLVGPANAPVPPGHQQPAVPRPTWSVPVLTWVFKPNGRAGLHSAQTLLVCGAISASQPCDLGKLPSPSGRQRELRDRPWEGSGDTTHTPSPSVG